MTTPAAVAAPAELRHLQASLYGLAQVCTDALAKAVEHFQTDRLWLIGTMPSCGEEADAVESQGRGFLAHSQLPADQIEAVSRLLRDAADLRAVARCARHTAQLSWLLRQESQGHDAEALFAVIQTVGDGAVAIARKSVIVIASQNSQAALWAAPKYREVDAARRNAEYDLTRGHLVAQFPPTLLRMAHAIVWYMAIAAECMARLAARTAQPL